MPDLLLLSIASPLIAALLLLVPAPLAARKVVAGLGFAIPAFIALYLWRQFPSANGADYHFVSQYDTGLKAALGISLHLGLNGIALPLFVLAGVVGLAAGLYALQTKAERPALYLGLLLVMQAGHVVQYDTPEALLQDSKGVFRSMVNALGEATAAMLEAKAKTAAAAAAAGHHLDSDSCV